MEHLNAGSQTPGEGRHPWPLEHYKMRKAGATESRFTIAQYIAVAGGPA